MGKSNYKKVNGKSVEVQDRLHHKGIVCTSDKWFKWAKRFLSKADRRNGKRESKEVE